MYCFQHQNQNAVGICRSCAKAICISCVKDTGRGVVCSESCETELKEINEINDRAKLVYGIAKKSSLPPTGVMFQTFFGLIFIGFGLYPLTQDRNPEWLLASMGAVFLVFGIMSFLRTRKLKLNC
jgi:hypothetical protein